MLRTVALISSVTVLSGCALPTLDQGSINALKGKSVVRVVPPVPRMAIVTPASLATVTFGAVGTALAAASNAKMGGVASFDTPNPALAVADKLAERLAQRYGSSIVGTTITQKTSGLGELAAVAGPVADYALEVTTANLIMGNFMTEPSRYRIQFLTVAVLVDNKTQQRIATGVCNSQPEDTKIAATFDEMVANGGERAKRDIAAGAAFCTHKLLGDMFSK